MYYSLTSSMKSLSFMVDRLFKVIINRQDSSFKVNVLFIVSFNDECVVIIRRQVHSFKS